MKAFDTSFLDTTVEKMRVRNIHVLQCNATNIVAVFFALVIHNIVICYKYYFSLASVSVSLIAKSILVGFCFTDSKPLTERRLYHGSGC